MIYKNIEITEKFLQLNPNAYFVFGDNLERRGLGGAAALRHNPHALGFITKKFPDNKDNSFYDVTDYHDVFFEEINKLKRIIKSKPDKTFYISKLGSGLANRYHIWEKLIRKNLVKTFENFDNVIFCWEKDIL